MELKVLLILLLGFISISSQDSPCNADKIISNGTDVSLEVSCSSFAPVVSYSATGFDVEGKDITVSIGYTCTNSTGAVIAEEFIATSLIATTKTKSLTTSFTTGTECTFSGCYFLSNLIPTPAVYKSLAIEPTPCTIDLDECEAGTHDCDVNAECVNTLGSYWCQCRLGFEGNGTHCTNIDECKENLHNCSNAMCFDTEGSYNCTCDPGYESSDLFSCTNTDECIESEHNCSEHALCTDTEGSYNCTCGQGYEGNGFTCMRISDCTKVCSENAVCVEEERNYECICRLGFTGDGITCNPVAECLECDVNAVCVNTEDSYTCACKEGYDGDGNTCRSTKDSKAWIPGLSSMAAVAVIIASMAVVVVFVLGKRKSLFQIPECLICTKKHDLIGFFYDTEVDLNYVPVDPERKPYDDIFSEPPEIICRLEPCCVDEDAKISLTCLTELQITTDPSEQTNDQNQSPPLQIHIQSLSDGNSTCSSNISSGVSPEIPGVDHPDSPILNGSHNCETKLWFVGSRKSRISTTTSIRTALPSVTGDESGFVESDSEGYMYIPTFSESNESDQKELSDGASIPSEPSYDMHIATDQTS